MAPVRQNIKSKLMFGTKNLLLSDYFSDMVSRRVPVPARVSNGMFLLDFESTLKEVIVGQQKINDDKFRLLVSMIVKVYDTLEAKQLAPILIEAGLKVPVKGSGKSVESEEEALTRMIDTIKERIARQITESGFSGAMISTFFTESAGSFSFTEFKGIDLASVSLVVRETQSFYSKFILGGKGDDLAMTLNSAIATNPILHSASALLRVFYSAEGMYVTCRESFIMDKIFKDVFGKPLVSKDTLFNGRFYEITDIDMPDLSYADALAMYLWSINQSMGIDVALDDKKQVLSAGDIIKELVTGVGLVLPFLPSEAGKPNVKKAQDHYKRIYLINLIRRISSDLPGSYYNSITNNIKNNRFFKLDESETEFHFSLKVLSMAYEAFRDTAAYYKDMYTRKDVFFSDTVTLHAKKRDKITEFVEKLVDQLKGSIQNAEHPAYYKLASHVTNTSETELVSSPYIPDWTVDRKAVDDATSLMMMPSGTSLTIGQPVLRVMTSGLHPSSTGWFDILGILAPLQLPYAAIVNATRVKPEYYFTVPDDSVLLNSDAIQAQLSFMSQSEIDALAQKNRVVADMIQSVSQRFTPYSAEEFSMRMKLPVEVARAILNRDGVGSSFTGSWYDLSGLVNVTYFLSPHLSPIYEVIENDEPNRYLPPFIGIYPTLLTEQNMAYDMYAAAAAALDYQQDPARKDNKGKDPKSKPSPKGKGTRGKGQEAEEEEEEASEI